MTQKITKRAFSLIELLISLIVISCITAAFTPLITKKFATNIGFGGSGGSSGAIATKCDDKFSAECLLCNDTVCLSCSKICPDNLCQDADNCVCKECPTSEFPNCAKFTSTGCIQCQKGYRLADNQCAACPDGRYSDNGLECKYCDPGFWPSADKTSCEPCPEGYICNDGVQIKCSGTTAPTIEESLAGVLGSTHVCAPCPSGSYCVDGVATKCPEGTYSQGNVSQCASCPDNEYPTEDQSACTSCPEGYYCSGSQKVECSLKFKNCTECDASGCKACKEGYILSDGACQASSEEIMQVGNLYVTKYNMGDRPVLTIPSTVTVLTAGNETCKTSKCCWKGQTAYIDYCDSNNGGYNGCKRTVCNYAAAREICAKFDLDGSTWRLPSYTEMSTWKKYSFGAGADGLQLCSNTSSSSSDWARCDYGGSCRGSYNGDCYPGYLWTNEINTNSYVKAYAYYLSGSDWSYTSKYRNSAYSVRCVSDAADTCPRGTYKNGSTCSSCSSKFPNCSVCNSNECFECSTGYEKHFVKKTCVPSIENAIAIENIYITKFNMGDNGLPIPSTVTTLATGSGNCTTTKCCWKGRTAYIDYCDSNNGGYSGCTRTVCNYAAAQEICAQYTAGGKTWRLPSYTEMNNWYFYSAGSGVDGLQLCSDTSSSSSDWARCDDGGGCNGSYNGSCYPGNLWTSDAVSNNYSLAYYYYLNGSSWRYSSSYRSNAYSVRCVADLD